MVVLAVTTQSLFQLVKPEKRSVRPMDIVTSLTRIPRFNGHGTRVVSVAEHSIYVADYFGREHPFYKHALVHDFHEAYFGDLTNPVQRSLLKGHPQQDHIVNERIHDRKDRLDWAIWHDLSLKRPQPKASGMIVLADQASLFGEAEVLFPEIDPVHFGYVDGLPKIDILEARNTWTTPHDVKAEFCLRLSEAFPDWYHS